MNDLKLLKILQSIEELDSKPPDEVVIETIEIIYFEKFEQIHRQKFKAHAQMFSEYDVVVDMNDIHYIFGIMLFQILQDLEFDTRLVIVLLFILDDLNRYVLFLLVINASQRSSE